MGGPGRHRGRIEDIELQLLDAIGSWLSSYRRRTLPNGQRPGWSDDSIDNEVLIAWYGEERGGELIRKREQRWRSEKRILIAIGLAFAVAVIYTSIL